MEYINTLMHDLDRHWQALPLCELDGKVTPEYLHPGPEQLLQAFVHLCSGIDRARSPRVQKSKGLGGRDKTFKDLEG